MAMFIFAAAVLAFAGFYLGVIGLTRWIEGKLAWRRTELVLRIGHYAPRRSHASH